VVRFNSRSVLSLFMVSLVVPSGVEPASQWPCVYSASRLPRTNPETKKWPKCRKTAWISPGGFPRAKVEKHALHIQLLRAAIHDRKPIPGGRCRLPGGLTE